MIYTHVLNKPGLAVHSLPGRGTAKPPKSSDFPVRSYECVFDDPLAILARHQKSCDLGLFEIARVRLRFDHNPNTIVDADRSIM